MAVPVNKDHPYYKLPENLRWYHEGFIGVECGKKFGKRMLFISDTIQMDVVNRALSGQGYSKEGINSIKKDMEKIKRYSIKHHVNRKIYEKNYKQAIKFIKAVEKGDDDLIDVDYKQYQPEYTKDDKKYMCNSSRSRKHSSSRRKHSSSRRKRSSSRRKSSRKRSSSRRKSSRKRSSRRKH